MILANFRRANKSYAQLQEKREVLQRRSFEKKKVWHFGSSTLRCYWRKFSKYRGKGGRVTCTECMTRPEREVIADDIILLHRIHTHTYAIYNG